MALSEKDMSRCIRMLLKGGLLGNYDYGEPYIQAG